VKEKCYYRADSGLVSHWRGEEEGSGDALQLEPYRAASKRDKEGGSRKEKSKSQ